uniref:Uncharacterized protein n=1 Tax=Romanomermis culicivorax TaxID=13658 RepID=A0A915KZN9_ROMCU
LKLRLPEALNGLSLLKYLDPVAVCSLRQPDILPLLSSFSNIIGVDNVDKCLNKYKRLSLNKDLDFDVDPVRQTKMLVMKR